MRAFLLTLFLFSANAEYSTIIGGKCTDVQALDLSQTDCQDIHDLDVGTDWEVTIRSDRANGCAFVEDSTGKKKYQFNQATGTNCEDDFDVLGDQQITCLCQNGGGGGGAGGAPTAAQLAAMDAEVAVEDAVEDAAQNAQLAANAAHDAQIAAASLNSQQDYIEFRTFIANAAQAAANAAIAAHTAAAQAQIAATATAATHATTAATHAAAAAQSAAEAVVSALGESAKREVLKTVYNGVACQ